MIYYFIFLTFPQAIINTTDNLLSPTINGNFINLGSSYIISKIEAAKIDNNPFNYLLGIFEAPNNSDFSDGFPIAMIKEGDLHDSSDLSIDINSPSAYRYIRYIPPKHNNKKLDNFKIYGHALVDGEDLSSRTPLRVTINLPLMVIKTENSLEPISKEIYVNCQIIIINTDKKIKNKTARIRVRGHSTANAEKKPYKIKFDKKQKVLNIDSEYKNWALLANHYDESLIRNSLAFEISRIIGLPFTHICRFLSL